MRVCGDNINIKSTTASRWKTKLDAVKDFRLTPLGASHSDAIDSLKVLSMAEWQELSHYLTCKYCKFCIVASVYLLFLQAVSLIVKIGTRN